MSPALLRWHRRRRQARRLARIHAEIERHAIGLRIKRLQILWAPRPTTADRSRWEKEKQRFLETTLRPAMPNERPHAQRDQSGADRSRSLLRQAALRRIERVARRGGGGGFDPAMHPLEYERFCARLLQKAGWKTALTPASGDQGADILARRRGCTLVVQCKLYRGAVGNDAVQQVAAARAHQGAQAAIVVSNARFTAAARALARSNRVALLHHEELPSFDPGRAPSKTIASATW